MGEEIAAVIIIHFFGAIRPEFRTVVRRVKKAQRKHIHAKKANRTRHHPAVKFHATKHVALHHLLSESLFDEHKDGFHRQGDGDVADNVVREQAEKRLLAEQITDDAIKKRARGNNEQPHQGIEHLLGKPAFTATHDADADDKDSEKINPSNVQAAHESRKAVEPFHNDAAMPLGKHRQITRIH